MANQITSQVVTKELSELLDNVFQAASQHHASDIHLRPGEPVRLRVGDQLVAARATVVQDKDIFALLQFVRGNAVLETEWRHLDFSFHWQQVGRLRVHAYRQRQQLCAIVRLVPSRIPSLEELRLPPGLRDLTEQRHGLVLVTGATGMGKSTTLASMLNQTAQERRLHMVTIEDPIEFEIVSDKTAISQREVGVDVLDFQEGMRAAMREDPDIIMVGEIRDLDTLRHTLLASESGHLVLGTIHTRDAPSTIGKLIGFFPREEQTVARLRLADSLIATISQTLLPMKGARTRVVATEMMVATPLIRERIRDITKSHGIVDAMEKAGGESGMHTFDDSVIELIRKGVIEPDVGKRAVRSPDELVRLMHQEGLVKIPAEEFSVMGNWTP
jgi:twitching motility protein PilT